MYFSLTSSAGAKHSEKKSTTLGKWHYLTIIPGHFIGFPVRNQEGFLVGEKQKRAPPQTIAIITMITREDKIIQGAYLWIKILVWLLNKESKGHRHADCDNVWLVEVDRKVQ